MFKWLGKAKQYFSKKKKPPEVSQTRSGDSQALDSKKLEAKRQASLKSQEQQSPSGRDPKQMWKMRLHVIGGKESTMGGHSFLSLIDPSGKNEMVMGMRTYMGSGPGSSSEDTQGALFTLKSATVGHTGVINTDAVDLRKDIPRDSDSLVSKTWDVSERQALAAMAKFNRDRRLNQARLPDLSKSGGHDFRKKMEDVDKGDFEAMRTEAGGPRYHAIANNCATWALSVIDETQKSGVLKKMPGVPGQKDTKIDTSPFRKKGVAIPHHMRQHLTEKGAAKDYQERMKEVDKEIEKRKREQKKREAQEKRKNLFKDYSEYMNTTEWGKIDVKKMEEFESEVGDVIAAGELRKILMNRKTAGQQLGARLTQEELEDAGLDKDKFALTAFAEIGAVEPPEKKIEKKKVPKGPEL